jgi:hypothetical protein
VVVAIATVAATGCGADVVKDYGAEAKANFVDGCTTERKVVDGKLIVTKIAGTDASDQAIQTKRCTCIYDYISNKKHQLSFDDLTAYETKVNDASAGNPPKPPALLTKAIKACPEETTGPTVPKSTTTTTKA